jgi:sigma-B regulation protein RsbU (phosphoserine phosphatase)
MALTWELPEPITLDPVQEAERLASLHSVELLENVTEDRFDRVTKLAADFFQVPTAYIAFIDSERQWYKSSVGMCPAETSRNFSLCQYTIQRNEPLIIPDTLEHALAQTHPMVRGEPYLRFYAGVPLAGPRGQKIGTFCLVDLRPRKFSEEDLAQLLAFASIVQREIGLSDIIHSQKELLSTRQKLIETEEKLRREFDDASKYVRLMLPPPLDGRETIDWHFQPSTQLGGDGLGYRRINEDQIAFYALDVTGHGLGSALMAVTALDVLRADIKQLDFSRPGMVIERVNRLLQMKDHAGKFFSVWYGVYSHSARTITYTNAGHPPPLLLTRGENGAPVLTKTASVGGVLGVFPEIEVKESTLHFPAGSELLLFTDGIYETRGAGKSHGSYDEFLHYLEAQLVKEHPPYESMLAWLESARERQVIDDDVTLLRFAVKS